MTTPSPADAVRQAALAAIAALPIAEPLTLGEPVTHTAALDFDGVAVTARFTGGTGGEVVVAVERAVSEALQGSALGSLDLGSALAPALAAAAGTVGTVQTGPGQVLDVRPALDALLSKPGAAVVPLLHQGVVRAVVGLAVAASAAPAVAPTTPLYPTLEEARATAAAPGGMGAQQIRRGLDLLRDVHMEVTAQIGATRMTVNELLTLTDGAVVELDRAAGAPADLLVNGHLIARGEVVVVDENFGLRITEIVVGDEMVSAPA
ncbi:flagellar motor switch protein FliN [Rhodococcus sp. X156]|uniref:flagellar motor switch protein FliN n=1 Tax=Rhodococcus sp. X156 TaxID=2499145 RepID=UPI000FDAD791|nr:flagellar motor switch protein FliN [Rhodococcus sp. X156]